MMTNIIGTIISVENFLKNEETRVNVSQNTKEDAPIIFEKDREYIIPDFQREVRWKKENIVELISDINDGERFLGNIILSKRLRSKYEIIDGQQRITMLLLLLQYIKFISGKSVDVFSTCPFHLEVFDKFQELLDCNFDDKTLTPTQNQQINTSDIFNQRKRYKELWEAIDVSSIITSGTSRNFLTKLSRCEFNVLLNTAIDGGYSIQYFLDVNLKGVRLDTEDILKSYLFSYDKGSEIRVHWKNLKKRIFQIEDYTPKYSLIKVVEQFLYCDLFKEEPFKSSGITFNEKFQLKYQKKVKGVDFYKNDHMVKVINDNEYFRKALEAINKYLDIYFDVVSIDGISAKFRELFIIDNKKVIQEKEINVIHNLLKKIMLDENVVPKVLVMKYLLELISPSDKITKADVQKVYGIYCLSLLFTVFDDKRSSSQITDITKMDNWNEGIITQINKYLNTELSGKRLAAKYSVILLSQTDDALEDVDNVALNNYQYRCKSLATIYNFFRINKDSVSVMDKEKLYEYLNDETKYSTEHFILNKSGTYKINNINEQIPYPGDVKKYINSLLNFIFIPKTMNGKWGNSHISNKLLNIESDKEKITCEYSKMILDLSNEFFKNKPDNISSLSSNEDIKNIYEAYYENNFLTAYSDYAAEAIKKIVEKIRNN